ncbi:hypothetical protein LJC58_10105 [Lachnospiraceae bacterium OttesenSCG-928-D06]|nr:hypothetical protein [Lachnospiraceae bacterium OttesenSCG-928-D06]
MNCLILLLLLCCCGGNNNNCNCNNQNLCNNTYDPDSRPGHHHRHDDDVCESNVNECCDTLGEMPNFIEERLFEDVMPQPRMIKRPDYPNLGRGETCGCEGENE